MKSEAWREDACRAEMSGLIICTWEHACWAALAQPDADRPPRGCSLAGTQLTAVPPRRGLPGLPRQQEGDTTDPAPWRLARLPGGGLRRGVIQATARPHAPPFGSLPLGHRCPWLPAVPALHRHGARFGRRDQPPRMAPTQTLRGAPFTEEGGHPQRSPWPARHSCYQLSAGAPTPGAGRRARVAPYNNMQIAPLTLNFR